MNKKWLVVMALLVVIIIGFVLLFAIPAPTVNAPAPVASSTPIATTTVGTANPLADTIVVTAPLSGATVASPLTVTGKARGTYYFEASFPVQLKDAGGNILAQGPAKAQSDWMTTDFVPFTLSLTFPAQPAGSHGTLVLMNDNPSGDPANQKELDIPVTF